MNNQKSQLILRIPGEGGKSIRIDDDKCLLRSFESNQFTDCCAIYNGSNGTAIRAYSNNVMVNGEATSAQWLQEGDRIELPGSLKLEVESATKVQPINRHRDRDEKDVADRLSQILQVPNLQADLPEAEVFESLPTSTTEATKVDSIAPESIPIEVIQQQEAGTISTEQETDAVRTDIGRSDHSKAILESVFSNLGISVEEATAPSQPQQVVEAPAPPAAPIPLPPLASLGENSQIETAVEPATSVPAELISPQAPEVPTVDIVDTEQCVEEQPTVASEEDIKAQIAAKQSELESIFGSFQSDEVAPVTSPPTPVAIETPRQPEEQPAAMTEFNDPSTSHTPEPVDSLATQATSNVSSGFSIPAPAVPSSSELPAELRDQLNDLVMSLETESANPPPVDPLTELQPIPTQSPVAVEPTSEPVQEAFPEPAPSPAPEFTERKSTEKLQSFLPSELRAQEAAFPQEKITETQQPNETELQLGKVEEAPAAIETPAAATSSPGVAEILGSMGFSVPTDDDDDGTASVAPMAAPEPRTPESVTPEPTPESAPSEETDDIQAYMNRLLNRSSAEEVAQEKHEAEEQASVDAALAKQEPPKVLSEEEFVPRQKAQRVEDFDTLREIANSSSRSDILASNARNLKDSVQTKTGLFIATVIGSAGAYYFDSKLAMIAFVGAAVCTSYLFYQAHLKREQDALQKAKSRGVAGK